MKALRIILGTLLGLAALYLVLCLVGPKKVHVLRTVEIEAPAAVIYGYIYDFRQWPQWSPWQLADSTIKNTYSGRPYGVGSVNSWTSEKSGSGSQEIIEEDAPKFLKTRLQFNGWDGYSFSEMKLEDKEGCKTLMSWSMEGDTPVPFFMRAMMIFMSRSIIGDYDEGLENLKKLSEEKVSNLPNSYRGITIEQTDFPAHTYASIRQRIPMSEMQSFFETGGGVISKALAGAKLTPSGAFTGLYYEWDDAGQKTDMAVAMPVTGATAIPGIELVELPASKAVVASYMGNYDGLANAHFAIDDYMRERCMVPKMPVVEEYVTDPMLEPDTSKWETRIYYFYE